MKLKGIPASEGIAIGIANVYTPTAYSVMKSSIKPGAVSDALAAFHNAISKAEAEINALITSIPAEYNDQAKIFIAHREMLSDEDMIEIVTNLIENGLMAPDYAVSTVFADYVALLSKSQDTLFSARAADLMDVRNRIIRILYGEKEQNLSHLPENSIIVAHDLMPSDTATLDRRHIYGIITETGSETSHSAIIARSYQMPAVLGVNGACTLITTGDSVIVDATTGEILLAADNATTTVYEKKHKKWLEERELTDAYLDKEPVTKDGVCIDIGINIGSDSQGKDFDHADFSGLFRTEFLYMESDHLPTEEEQFTAYKRVLEQANEKYVTLRTLDIGGDKSLPYLQLPKEDNPFLGKRAIRLCFDEINIFKTQLRAAYRASVFGKLMIMFPMITSLDDVRRAKAIAWDVKAALRAECIPFDESVPLGVMIEIPAAAIIADLIAEEVDFASIGTNDLCQYLCAADRMNSELTSFYQSFSPSMLRILKSIASAFQKKGKPLSVCGEMAGDPRATVLLIGLGIKKLSMSVSSIASVKKALSAVSLKQAKQIVAQALKCTTESEVLLRLVR